MSETDTEAARNAMLQRLPGAGLPAKAEEAVTDDQAAAALDFIKDTPITPILSGAERVKRMRAETQYGAFRKIIGAKFIAGKLGMNYEEIEMMKQKILGVASHESATPEQVIAAGETLCRLIQTQLGVVEKDHKMLEEIPMQGDREKMQPPSFTFTGPAQINLGTSKDSPGNGATQEPSKPEAGQG